MTTGKHPGATQTAFDSRINYQKHANGCSVTSALITVNARVVLPHWRRPPAATESALGMGYSFGRHQRHEESHVIVIITMNNAHCSNRRCRPLAETQLGESTGWGHQCDEEGATKHYAAHLQSAAALG